MTNFEHATKIPLMIGCPGGKCVGRTSALVESIDIMPTLLQEAGITAPACPPTHAGSRATTFCVEGRSLSPLLREPTTPTVLAGYGAAYSQFPRPEHPQTIDLSCRDDPKTQKGCASGPCLDGCPNKMGKSVQCPSLWWVQQVRSLINVRPVLTRVHGQDGQVQVHSVGDFQQVFQCHLPRRTCRLGPCGGSGAV